MFAWLPSASGQVFQLDLEDDLAKRTVTNCQAIVPGVVPWTDRKNSKRLHCRRQTSGNIHSFIGLRQHGDGMGKGNRQTQMLKALVRMAKHPLPLQLVLMAGVLLWLVFQVWFQQRCLSCKDKAYHCKQQQLGCCKAICTEQGSQQCPSGFENISHTCLLNSCSLVDKA
jgi:hypothetical protein